MRNLNVREKEALLYGFVAAGVVYMITKNKPRTRLYTAIAGLAGIYVGYNWGPSQNKLRSGPKKNDSKTVSVSNPMDVGVTVTKSK